MIAIKVLILFLTVLVFIQDMMYRAVNWVIFPLLAILFVFEKLNAGELLSVIMFDSGYNLVFLFLQLALVSLYFSIKIKRWTFVTTELLGWGDVMLLVCAACYFPFGSYILFYLGSIAAILIVWILIQQFVQTMREQVPLAGLQSLIMGILFLMNWIHYKIDWFDQLTKLWIS